MLSRCISVAPGYLANTRISAECGTGLVGRFISFRRLGFRLVLFSSANAILSQDTARSKRSILVQINSLSLTYGALATHQHYHFMHSKSVLEEPRGPCISTSRLALYSNITIADDRSIPRFASAGESLVGTIGTGTAQRPLPHKLTAKLTQMRLVRFFRFAFDVLKISHNSFKLIFPALRGLPEIAGKNRRAAAAAPSRCYRST
ncbi:hypothetical protein B0H17DRAFT_101727 [Mycena rosella]|uniref:Uncharacterized protein n=1 Tax=Mycena rosella TaxID=1033263 RepID=A0AAD7G8R8_MYCRO|nr:hypothetical protein B0H17DRAFT_101727 [Mycena rosella]